MTILYLLIPLSLMMIVIAITAFRWAIKNRQFDDLNAPSMIPLLDDSDEERQRQHPQNDNTATASSEQNHKG